MKLKRILRRAAALVLTASALAGPLAVPASKTSADTEFDVEGTAFTEPSYDTALMYFWHEGLPTVTKDKQGNYIKYPVLICWKDQYFLCTDKNFWHELNETHKMQGKENDNYVWIGGFESHYLGKNSYSHTEFDRVWGNCDYYMRYLYDTNESSLLSKLGVDLESLRTLGESVSLQTGAKLPYLVATSPETNQYAIGLDEGVFGKDYWLVGQAKLWEWVDTEGLIFRQDSMMKGDVQWCMDYQYWKADQFCDKNYTYKSVRWMYDVDQHKSYDYSEGPDQHYWTIKMDSNGLYHFWTMGENNIVSWGRISASQGKGKNRQRLRDWYHANDLGRMSIYYKDSRIGVNGETVKYKNWNDRKNTVDNTDGYKVYYADPNIVSFHKQSFEVVSGQVVNLDGPRVIDNQCTITVHDGGVLACNGWVINNGQILVEPGGMLILTDRETATGDYQYGAITSLGADPNSGSGRIACDGTIIVNRDCKLTCAGVYGLQLGEGAQVVNYGQIITENLEVYGDHTIENRGDSSSVFAGWGVTDSGYALTRSKITGGTYNAKGTLQDVSMVSVARNAVYGDNAFRFYVNGSNSVYYMERQNKKGYVSGFVAKIEGTSYVDDSSELPADIPIYYDERYKVAFIMVDGVIYHHDNILYYWVNVEDGNHEKFHNYRMPSAVEEYIPGELPDGYPLSDGRIVGQEVNEDLYYDHQAHLYWFVADLCVYYYEPALNAYIYVEDSTSYFRYPEELAPPPTYNDIQTMPGEMIKSMPLNTLTYQEGMQEIPASDVKPKVWKDDAGFYIVVAGYRLDWSAEHQMFVPLEGSLPDEERLDEEGNLRGIPADMVNLNGNDLSDPNAKPKVQKDGDRYYVNITSGDYPGRYYWYSSVQAFVNGDPYYNYAGELIGKDQVDLNGYTLP